MSLNANSQGLGSGQTEALHQTVFDAMLEGVMVLSRAGVVIMANPAAAQILSVPSERLPGMPLSQLMMRAIREDGTELTGAEYPAIVSLRTGEAISGFVMGVYKSGAEELLWASVNARPLVMADGSELLMLTFTDITALKQAEAQLRASEARFRNILHHTPIATAIVDLAGKFTEVNRNFCAIVGYGADELRSRDFQSITHPNDLDEGRDEIQRMLAGAIDSYQSERRFTREGNEPIWIMLTVSLQRDAQGAPLHFIIQIQDIGERRAAAEHIARVSQRLSLALGCADIGVWEWEIADNVVHVDEKVMAIYGLFQRGAPSSIEYWRAFVVPEDQRRTLVVFERLITQRRRAVMEYRIRRSDGVLRYMQTAADIVLDGDAIKSVIGVSIDITDRKLAERAVRAARRQLRTLIDSLPAWVGMLDRDGRFLVANNHFCESLGLPMSEVEGRYYDDVIPVQFRARHTLLVERCLAGESVEFMEQGIGPGKDTLVHCHGRYEPLYEGGRVIGLVLALTDVSELKRAQLQLTRLNNDLVNKVAEVHQLQARLHEMAVRDALTGLHNRRFLDEQLPYELARARRLRSPLCVALGDIDHFKRINDTYGHQAGDAVLRTLRELFTQLVRESDLVCRWGGEEILIVMPDVPGDVALQRIERLREALAARTVQFGQHQLRVTISFGIAAHQEGASADELIGAADLALYEAKAAGRNTSRLFSGAIPQLDDALGCEPLDEVP